MACHTGHNVAVLATATIPKFHRQPQREGANRRPCEGDRQEATSPRATRWLPEVGSTVQAAVQRCRRGRHVPEQQAAARQHERLRPFNTRACTENPHPISTNQGRP